MQENHILDEIFLMNHYCIQSKHFDYVKFYDILDDDDNDDDDDDETCTYIAPNSIYIQYT